MFTHGLHIYISENVGCSLEISTGRDLRVGRASTPFPKLAHGLHIYFSEYVSCSFEISTGRDFRVGRPCHAFSEACACPSQIEGVRCEPGNDILVYPLSATSRSMFVCTLHASSPALAEAVALHPTMEFLTAKGFAVLSDLRARSWWSLSRKPNISRCSC